MRITVEVSRLFDDRKDLLKAATNVILEDDTDRIVIKNVRVIDGQKGLFMSLPARKNVKNEYKEICYPLTGRSAPPYVGRGAGGIRRGNQESATGRKCTMSIIRQGGIKAVLP